MATACTQHSREQQQPKCEAIPRPSLLYLPQELRQVILHHVLHAECQTLVGPYFPRIWGFPLHNITLPKAMRFFPDTPSPISTNSLPGLLFSCSTLHNDTLALLASNFAFLVRVNVRADAPSYANHFAYIHALHPAFRSSVRRIVLHLSFMHGEKDYTWKAFVDYWTDNLAFEKIIENFNELLHLMRGVNEVHLVWDLYFGNSGMAERQKRGTRRIWRRVREEWPGRRLKLSVNHVMGRMEEGAGDAELT